MWGEWQVVISGHVGSGGGGKLSVFTEGEGGY
jgi:hypothetical protein